MTRIVGAYLDLVAHKKCSPLDWVFIRSGRLIQS